MTAANHLHSIDDIRYKFD